jgi:hypothetical protein
MLNWSWATRERVKKEENPLERDLDSNKNITGSEQGHM